MVPKTLAQENYTVPWFHVHTTHQTTPKPQHHTKKKSVIAKTKKRGRNPSFSQVPPLESSSRVPNERGERSRTGNGDPRKYPLAKTNVSPSKVAYKRRTARVARPVSRGNLGNLYLVEPLSSPSLVNTCTSIVSYNSSSSRPEKVTSVVATISSSSQNPPLLPVRGYSVPNLRYNPPFLPTPSNHFQNLTTLLN